MYMQEVHHPLYGKGEIKQVRNKGFELQVVFEDNSMHWVRIDDVKFITPTSETPKFSIVETHPYDLKDWKERILIEAFRLGIVPFDRIQDFIIGRKDEVLSLLRWMKSKEQNVAFVIGEYGSGKTHLLRYLFYRALDMKFVVSWIDVHPNETSLNRPKKVYQELVSSLKYRSEKNGKISGFRDFLKEALDKGLLGDHQYFKHLIGDSSSRAWEWIEGKSSYRPYWDQSYPPLYDYMNTANIYCHLISGLGWAAKKMGMRGYLVIFDEAETISSYYYKYEFHKSINFVKALIQTANNEEKLLGRPYGIGLDFCSMGGSDKVSFLYKKPSGLKLIFALTSMEMLPWELKYSDNYLKLFLHPLDEQSLKQIIRQLLLIYQNAYNLTMDNFLVNQIFKKVVMHKDPLRMFVKGTVEALDLMRFYPERDILEILS